MFEFIKSNNDVERDLVNEMEVTNELLKQSDILQSKDNNNIREKVLHFKKEIKYLLEYNFNKEYVSIDELDNLKFNTIYGLNKHVYVFELETMSSYFVIFVYDYSIYNENKIDVQIILEKGKSRLVNNGIFYKDLVLNY